MIGLMTLFIILLFSVTIINLAAKALLLTGLSKDIASFQAKSAFTGTGYTTQESESIVNHPVRRRIVSLLMTASNIGFVSIIATSVLTFVNVDDSLDAVTRLFIMFLLAGVVLFLSKNKLFDNIMTRLFKKYLEKYTTVELKDYANILQLGDFGVSEISLCEDNWMVSKSIRELGLTSEGIIILGIHMSNGEFLGIPSGEYILKSDDRLILYGRNDFILALEQRKQGEQGNSAHKEAVEKAVEIVQEEREKEQVVESATI